MEPMTLIVGPDGRVRIPGTGAGQIVTIRIEGELETRPPRSSEEWERVIQEQIEDSRQARASMEPEELARALNHGKWLYGPDGLPR